VKYIFRIGETVVVILIFVMAIDLVAMLLNFPNSALVALGFLFELAATFVGGFMLWRIWRKQLTQLFKYLRENL
jgi:hypothetical protein